MVSPEHRTGWSSPSTQEQGGRGKLHLVIFHSPGGSSVCGGCDVIIPGCRFLEVPQCHAIDM